MNVEKIMAAVKSKKPVSAAVILVAITSVTVFTIFQTGSNSRTDIISDSEKTLHTTSTHETEEPAVTTETTTAESEATTQEQKEETMPETSEQTAETTIAETEIEEVTAEKTEVTYVNPPKVVETYKEYVFSSEDWSFVKDCAFIGDSVCYGFYGYGIVDASQNIAQGNTAARNILEFTFRSKGKKVDLITAIKNSGKKNLVFLMGMNDINITDKETYVKNYDNLLKLVEEAVPDANIFVCSITPVTAESTFAYNSKIDAYNEALRKMLKKSKTPRNFVDVSEELSNSAGCLKSDYNGGDGVHLAGPAYHAILYKLCEVNSALKE